MMTLKILSFRFVYLIYFYLDFLINKNINPDGLRDYHPRKKIFSVKKHIHFPFLYMI